MKFSSTLVFALALAGLSFGGEALNPSLTDHVFFSGRWEHKAQGSCASAPAVNIQFSANAKAITFDLEGYARWRFDIDGRTVTKFETSERVTKKLGAAGDGKFHSYRLVKISESNPGEVCLHDIRLDALGTFGDKPEAPKRKIEFIGDSFTVGFGNEGSNTDSPDLEFEKTDASKSYAFLLSDGFKADFQVNAVSGRGLVRNYGNIVPEWTLENLYDLTVAGTASPASARWNPNDFHPQVIVIFMGINDFQGEPPYADRDAFKAHYSSFLSKLRAAHPGVKFLLLSTKVWPNDDLTPAVAEVYEAELAMGHKDLEFKEIHTDNVGLLGHPDTRAHEEIANVIRPIVARLGGWLSR